MKLPSRAEAEAFIAAASEGSDVREVLQAFEKDMMLVKAVARVYLDLDELSPEMLLALTARLDKYFCETPDDYQPPVPETPETSEEDVERLLNVHRNPPIFLVSRNAPPEYGELGADDRFFYWGEGCDTPGCFFHNPSDTSNEGLRKHIRDILVNVLSYLPSDMLTAINHLLDSEDTRFTLTKYGILARVGTRYN